MEFGESKTTRKRDGGLRRQNCGKESAGQSRKCKENSGKEGAGEKDSRGKTKKDSRKKHG